MKRRTGNKYGAIATYVDGIRFDSKKEARRYGQLKLMERAGIITDLELQPRYKIVVKNSPICTYVADFRYYDKQRLTQVIEDVKSTATATPVYKIKKKLTEALYDITVTEI